VLEEVVIFLTTSKVVDTLPPALVAIVGTDGSDYPQGGSSNDVIFGLAGNDLILATIHLQVAPARISSRLRP
jgi:hypothetical protein